MHYHLKHNPNLSIVNSISRVYTDNLLVYASRAVLTNMIIMLRPTNFQPVSYPMNNTFSFFTSTWWDIFIQFCFWTKVKIPHIPKSTLWISIPITSVSEPWMSYEQFTNRQWLRKYSNCPPMFTAWIPQCKLISTLPSTTLFIRMKTVYPFNYLTWGRATLPHQSKSLGLWWLVVELLLDGCDLVS